MKKRLKRNAKNILINKRELRKLNEIGREGGGQLIEHYKRCFKRITNLRRDCLKEGLTTFNIYIKSLNCS
jgi:hypothetical protein